MGRDVLLLYMSPKNPKYTTQTNEGAVRYLIKEKETPDCILALCSETVRKKAVVEMPDGSTCTTLEYFRDALRRVGIPAERLVVIEVPDSMDEETQFQAISQLLEKIKALGYVIKLDTNGAFPERLEAVVCAGLADYVAMDIKNSPARYAETAGVPGLALTPIFRSVSFLLRGTVDYEFRTTAVAELHDDASFVQLGDWLMGAKRYFIQCFEPRDTVLRAGLSAPSEMQLHCWAELVRPKIPAVEIRGI